MRGLGTAFVALVGLVLPAAAGATTITVNTTTDTTGAGVCSLREAISAVDSPGTGFGNCPLASTGSDTIVLGAGEYALSIRGEDDTLNQSGDLNVFGAQTALMIVGAGEGATSIDASDVNDRVLNVAGGATVTLRDLTVTGGFAPPGSQGLTGPSSSIGNGLPGGNGGPGENGGGILNAGTLTLDHVAVTGNRAGQGGNGGQGGASTSSSGNGGAGGNGGSGGNGGGIYNSGTLTVTDSSITNNNGFDGEAGGFGGPGGDGGTSANGTGGAGGEGAAGGSGGGIYNAGTLTITGSTLAGNFTGWGGDGGRGADGTPGGPAGFGGDGGDGGGISSTGGPLSITNSTIADNGTQFGGGGGMGGNTDNDLQPGGNGGDGGDGGVGGGLQLSVGLDSLALLLNLTVAENQIGRASDGGDGGNVGGLQGSSGSPGGAGAGGGVADLDIPFPGTAVVLQNTLLASNAGGNCDGFDLADGRHNLSFGDQSCDFAAGDPKLGPLEDNGGPTETMALGAGSAAIDAVPSSGAGCPATDQRGALRPAGAGCDTGAYELATPAATTGPATGPSTTSVSVTGMAFNPDLAPGTAYFQYGRSTAYGASSPHQATPATSSAAPVSAVLTGLSPGTTYHYRLVVTNAVGAVFGADHAFTTTTSGPGAGAPAGGSGSGSARPTIARLRITPDRFSRRHGATVTYSLDEAATATFRVLRPLPGRRHGHTCAKPSRANRAGSRCVRWVAIGRVFTHASGAGNARFKLAPALAAGDYRLQARASAGGLPGNTVTDAFDVIAAPRVAREPTTRGGAR